MNSTLRRGLVCSCYYTSAVCKYFVDGECYENYTSIDNASECERRFGGAYYLNGRCHYRLPRNCSGYYIRDQCACYPHRSSTYSNYTCHNIDGYYAGDYCYYTEFDCSGYAANDQCYTRVNY